MRKFILETLAMAIVIISITSLINCIERNYTRHNCEVVEVDCIEVGAIDSQGHRWNFKADGLQVGDKVTLIMHDNYTTNDITDDIVEGVK
jgi:hypothetical protein